MLCESCGTAHSGQYGSGRFCSSRCAKSFSTSLNRSDIHQKISDALRGRSSPKSIGIIRNFDCLNCQTLIVQRVIPYRTRIQKYCSQKCYRDFQRQRYAEHCDDWTVYKLGCRFTFNVFDYPAYFDLDLIRRFGWYAPTNRGNNLEGISRDHMVSIKHGFSMRIDSRLIAHPANCRLIQHRLNQRKNRASSITVDELLERIESFNSKYIVKTAI